MLRHKRKCKNGVTLTYAMGDMMSRTMLVRVIFTISHSRINIYLTIRVK